MARPARRPPVRSVPVPEEARALCTLGRIDYADATAIEVGDPGARTAEQWVRAVFDDPPQRLRLSLWSAWRTLGLRLGSPSTEARVLGWKIEHSTPDSILLGAGSHVGMPAQLLLLRRPDSLLFDTFVRQDNPIARSLWRSIEPAHRRIVPEVLGSGLRMRL